MLQSSCYAAAPHICAAGDRDCGRRGRRPLWPSARASTGNSAARMALPRHRKAGRGSGAHQLDPPRGGALAHTRKRPAAAAHRRRHLHWAHDHNAFMARPPRSFRRCSGSMTDSSSSSSHSAAAAGQPARQVPLYFQLSFIQRFFQFSARRQPALPHASAGHGADPSG